jgi:hypothetical protein
MEALYMGYIQRSKNRISALSELGDICVWTSDQSHNNCHFGLKAGVSGSLIRGVEGITRSRTDRRSVGFHQKKYKGPSVNTADVLEFNVKNQRASDLSARVELYEEDIIYDISLANSRYGYYFKDLSFSDLSAGGTSSDEESMCSVTLASAPESMEEAQNVTNSDEEWTVMETESESESESESPQSDFDGDTDFVLVRDSPDVRTYAEILLAAAEQPVWSFLAPLSSCPPVSTCNPAALRDAPVASPRTAALDDTHTHHPFYEDYVQAKTLKGGKATKRYRGEGKTQRRYSRSKYRD